MLCPREGEDFRKRGEMMDNRYKFRGVRTENKTWVYGAYFEHLPPSEVLTPEKSKHYMTREEIERRYGVSGRVIAARGGNGYDVFYGGYTFCYQYYGVGTCKRGMRGEHI